MFALQQLTLPCSVPQAALLSHFKPPSTEVSVTGFVGVLGAVMATVIILIFIARWFGKFAFI
jgi:hypothetical protein